HQAEEPELRVLHHLGGHFPGLFIGRLEGAWHRLQRPALHLLDLDTERAKKVGHIGPLEQHANRAGDGVAVDEDTVGGERHDIGGRGCERPAHGHHRLLLGKLPDRVIHRLTSGRGAAGTVDLEDHRLDLVRLADLVEQLIHLAVVGDDARHRNAGDMRQEAGRAREVLVAKQERSHKEQPENDGQDAPGGQPPLEAAAFDHGFGVENHCPSLADAGAASLAAGRLAHSSVDASRSAASLAGRLRLGLAPSSPSSPLALLSAAPRMSPSEAPESVEPYWATASFSSAISSALIDTPTLRAFESTWGTTASNFSPTPKRSGRWCERSRERSDRLMKVVRSWSRSFASIPLSLTAITSQVTRMPFFSLAEGAPAANGSAVNCLIPRLMRSFSESASSTTALALSPFL